MKKLTKAESAAIPQRPNTRSTLVRVYIQAMQPGDIIMIEKHEWTWKRHNPGYICNQLRKQKRWKFTCNKILDGSGWVVERLK